MKIGYINENRSDSNENNMSSLLDGKEPKCTDNFAFGFSHYELKAEEEGDCPNKKRKLQKVHTAEINEDIEDKFLIKRKKLNEATEDCFRDKGVSQNENIQDFFFDLKDNLPPERFGYVQNTFPTSEDIPFSENELVKILYEKSSFSKLLVRGVGSKRNLIADLQYSTVSSIKEPSSSMKISSSSLILLKTNTTTKLKTAIAGGSVSAAHSEFTTVDFNSEPILDTDPEVLLRSFLYPVTLDSFIDDYFGKKALVVHGSIQRLRYIKKDFRNFDIQSLLSDAMQTIVWMKSMDGKMQYLDLTNGSVDIAASCYNAGHSLYFNPNMGIQKKYINAIGDALGLVSEEEENLELDENQPRSLFSSSNGKTGGNKKSSSANSIIDKDLSNNSRIPGDVEIFAVKTRHVTPWHFDGQDNFTIQARGIKKWTVIPLQSKGIQNPLINYHPSSSNRASCRRNFYLHQAYEKCKAKELYPPTEEEEKKYGVSFVMKPGSILYLPAGMWHKVEAFDDDPEDDGINVGKLNEMAGSSLEELSDSLIQDKMRYNLPVPVKYVGDCLSINFSMHGTRWVDYILRRVRKALCCDPRWRSPVMFGGTSYQKDLSKENDRFKDVMKFIEEDIFCKNRKEVDTPFSFFVPPVRGNRLLFEESTNTERLFDITNDDNIDILWEKYLYEEIIPSKSILLKKNPFITLIDADLGKDKVKANDSIQKISKVIYGIENDEENVRVHISYSPELESFVHKCSEGIFLRIKCESKLTIEWESEMNQTEAKEIEVGTRRLLAIFFAYGYMAKIKEEVVV